MTAAPTRFLHNGNVLWYLVPSMRGKRMTIFLGERDQSHRRAPTRLPVINAKGGVVGIASHPALIADALDLAGTGAT